MPSITPQMVDAASEIVYAKCYVGIDVGRSVVEQIMALWKMERVDGAFVTVQKPE